MYHRDNTLFQTLVNGDGFVGGLITGPKGRRGRILGIEINPHRIVVRWVSEDGKTVLPIVFQLRDLIRYHGSTEDGDEEEYFVISLSPEIQHRWVIYRPSPGDEKPNSDSPEVGE